jgi:autotransporter-associated beta strand protein
LRLENGTALNVGSLNVANDYGRPNSIEITGSGTSLTSNSITLGIYGSDSTITLSAGGQLTTALLLSEAYDSSATTINIGTGSRFSLLDEGGISFIDGPLVRFSLAGGTLALGNDTISLAHVNVGSAGGTIEVASGAAYFYGESYGNLLTGTGTLDKSGSGTLMFHADGSAFAGNVNVSAGSIFLTGILGGSSIGIDSGATFTFARSGVTTYAGDISGAGTLHRLGSGVTILTGAATHTGGTSILQGGLQIGAGGTTGSLAGDVATYDGTTFAISRSDAVTFSGNISGAGGFYKLGTGTTTLTGANTYTGGTTLAGGTLALGSSGALGSTGTLSFTGGTLQYSAANTTDYSARFSTAAGQAYAIDTNGQNITFATALTSSGGTLTKSGTGTLTLSGTHTYTGGTTVNGGTLALAGSAANSAFTIASGASLVGTGTVGSLTVAGTFAPGNSPGLVTVTGDLLLTGTSMTQMELGSLVRGTGYDGIDVGGSLSFGGTLSITLINGFAPALGDSFQLFTFTSFGGSFAHVNLPEITSGLTWNTSRLLDQGTLSIGAIPEPSAFAALAGLTTLALAATRRRRR